MNTADAWRVAVHQAAIRSQELMSYLVNAPHDRVAWDELGRLARSVLAAGDTHALAEVSEHAATLIAIADARVIDGRVLADLDAVMDRIVVLTDRASRPFEALVLPESDEGVELPEAQFVYTGWDD